MKKGEYLLCDATKPLISNSLREEMLLYNLCSSDFSRLKATFCGICQCDLPENITQLSGGQKVLLMVCLALFSPAIKIHFVAVRHSLDEARWGNVQSLPWDKEIVFSEGIS